MNAILPESLLSEIEMVAERKKKSGVGSYVTTPENMLALVQAVKQLRIALIANFQKDTGDPGHNPMTCGQPSCVMARTTLADVFGKEG